MSTSRILFLAQILLIMSCSPFKTMKRDQYLLDKQKIEGTDKLPASEFVPLYRIQTNKQIFGYMPLVSVYNFGAIFYDSSKVKDKIESVHRKFDDRIKNSREDEKKTERYTRQRDRKLDKLNKKLREGNWLMKMGEPPAVYDSSLIAQTVRLFQYHLLSKGFFEGTAKAENDTSGRRISVTYHLEEGPAFTVQELYYRIEDQRADSLVHASLKESKLKTGKRYDEADLTGERTRLTDLLKSNGYYDFSPSYIYYNVDTTGTDRTKIRLQTVIVNPEGMTSHPVYRIDSVYFINNRLFLDSLGKADTSVYKGITYICNKNFRFSKRIANRKISIHPGELYNESSTKETQKNLSTLNIFRTVAIRYKQDTAKRLLTPSILTTSFRRYSLNFETGLSFTDAFVPGPFGNLTYRKRNAFRGFELLDISLRGAITGQAAVLEPTSILHTEEYSIMASVSAPQLYFPGLRGSQWENNNPRTRIATGYTIVRRPEYERGAAKAGVVYTIDLDEHRQVSFSPIDLNIINTARISEDFQRYLDSLKKYGNNLIYGFTRSYVSDINASYTYNSYSPLQNKRSRMIRYYMESGGTFLNLANRETVLGLNAFSYIKLNADIRHYFPIKKSTLAVRFNLGIAKPYGISQALPYEKYYFAGGPNSIRAWKLRRLGPGSYAPIDSSTGQISYQIERPGELLLETSMEYRFKIISFFEGALFVDAGNSWMLTPDPARPGADFRFNSFISQVAVGTGAGLRLNFSFLIVRLDWGIKVYDPAVKKFVFPNPGINQSVLNVGIGYPF